MMKSWLVVGIKSGALWPTSDTRIRYRGHEFVLRAETETTAPTIDVQFEPPMTQDEAHLLIRRFMSSLSWGADDCVRETTSIVCSPHRTRIAKTQRPRILNLSFRADYLPEPSNPKAQLALSLYREAESQNSIPHQFLAYFKILNILHSTGKQQRDWINSVLPKFIDNSASNRLIELQSKYADIGEYLYESGRCAVVHTFDKPIVDPDNPKDDRRLEDDLPLIKALAKYLIEHEFGIKSQQTIWREHLYELDGFRQLLGRKVVDELKVFKEPELSTLPALPRLSLRLRDYPQFKSLEGLVPKTAKAIQGRFLLLCTSVNTPLRIAFCLDFRDERLEFDPTEDITLHDNGSPEIVGAAIDRLRLIQGLVANGQLEVWATESNTLLGRCDPWIPLNMDSRRTDENLRKMISGFKAELARRKNDPNMP